MHEHSLIRSLLAQVRQLADEQEAEDVEEIVIAVGPLAGVEPLLLASAFEQLATEGLFRQSRLTVEPEPLTLTCESCGESFEPEGFVFVCPRCGSPESRAVRGEEVILRSVALRMPDLTEARQ